MDRTHWVAEEEGERLEGGEGEGGHLGAEGEEEHQGGGEGVVALRQGGEEEGAEHQEGREGEGGPRQQNVEVAAVSESPHRLGR